MRSMRRLGLGLRSSASGGTPTPTPVTLATPTYYDAFDYTDGTRLVAGDPNANAGLVATNPGNLGWTATASGSANNARFNPIVHSGRIKPRTANYVGDFATPSAYALTAPGAVTPLDHYITLGASGGVVGATVRSRSINPDNFLALALVGTTLILTRRVGGVTTTPASLVAASTVRRLGGTANGSMSLFNRSDEKVSAMYVAGKAYIIRQPGYPIGDPAGYTYTDAGGTGVGIATTDDRSNTIDSIEMGAIDCNLRHDDTHNKWYPRIRNSASDIHAGGKRTITFTGTYTGTAPAKLQWALAEPETGAIVKDWDLAPTVSTVIGGGAWSITIDVPWGVNGRKAYNIGVRCVDASNVAYPATARFSYREFTVSINFGLIGQSNAAYLMSGTSAGTYPDYPGANTYRKADPPSLSKGTYDALSNYYEGTSDQIDLIGAVLGDELSAYFGGPVSFEVLAIPANGALNLGPSGANWTYIQTHHAFAGGAYEALYLSHGEAEFVAEGSLWESRWLTNLAAYRDPAMHGQPLGTIIPVFLTYTGRVLAAGQNNGSAQACRMGQDNLLTSGSEIVPCHTYVGCKMIDEYHYSLSQIVSGQRECARRTSLTVRNYYSSTGYEGVGPLATTATRAAAVITIDFDLNGATSMTCRDGTDQSLTGTATALTSWEVSTDDFATTKTITTAQLVGNQVVLTLSADPGGPVKVRNHYGFAPTITSWAFGAYGDGTYIGSKPIITPLVSN